MRPGNCSSASCGSHSYKTVRTTGSQCRGRDRLLVAQTVREAEDLQEFILGIMAIILTVSVGLALTMGWLLSHSQGYATASKSH